MASICKGLQIVQKKIEKIPNLGNDLLTNLVLYDTPNDVVIRDLSGISWRFTAKMFRRSFFFLPK